MRSQASHDQMQPKQHFHQICLPEEDIHWTLYQMGFIYTTQIQNQPHPHAHVSRCFRICSTASLLKSAVDDFKRLLLQNGYPQGVITFNINDVLNKTKKKPSDPLATVPKKMLLFYYPI